MHAVEPLIELLEDEDEDVRAAAKEALRKLGHEVE
jgi:HEAT repeat protein